MAALTAACIGVGQGLATVRGWTGISEADQLDRLCKEREIDPKNFLGV